MDVFYCNTSRCKLQLKGTSIHTTNITPITQWRTEGGWGVQPPPPEIPNALQNRAKLNPIEKTVKIAEFRKSTPQDVRKKRK